MVSQKTLYFFLLHDLLQINKKNAQQNLQHLFCYCFTDENECNRVINDCKDLNTKTLKQGVASCKDTVGSYDCVCASGFTYNSTSRVCTGEFVKQYNNIQEIFAPLYFRHFRPHCQASEFKTRENSYVLSYLYIVSLLCLGKFKTRRHCLKVQKEEIMWAKIILYLL